MSETETKVITQAELDEQQGLVDEELIEQMGAALTEPTTEPEPEDDKSTEESTEESDDSLEDDDNQDDDNKNVDQSHEVELSGRKLKQQEAEEALRLLDWANTLSPDQVNAINATLAAQNAPAPEPQPAPEAKPEYLDERAAADIARLQEEINALKQPVQTMQFNTQAQQVRHIETQIDVAKTQFQVAHPQADIDALEAQLQNLGIYGQLVTANNNNYAAAALQGFNMVYATSPDYNQNEVDDKMQQERDELASKRERKRKSASLAGRGGSVSRVPAPPNNKQERDAAMVEEIANALSNS